MKIKKTTYSVAALLPKPLGSTLLAALMTMAPLYAMENNETSINPKEIASLDHHTFLHTYQTLSKNSHICTECNKAFSTLTNLTRHQKIHLNERNHVCNHPGCGKSFTRSDELIIHKRIHTGERLFVCNFPNCNQTFGDPSAFALHKKSHSGEKNFVCNFFGCNKKFTQNKSLTRHKATHTYEKNFLCDKCGVAFARADELTQHQQTHIQEKTFKCEDCNKAFKRLGTLTIHKKTHTGEKPFECNFPNCSYKGISQDLLTHHKRNAHTKRALPDESNSLGNKQSRLDNDDAHFFPEASLNDLLQHNQENEQWPKDTFDWMPETPEEYALAYT
jgi:uncharacterized Zn-finger protein